MSNADKVKIFMDDLRARPHGWILARTTEECLMLLEENKGNVEALSLDHDMTLVDNDGYYVVHQMIERVLHADTVYFHTANRQGRENMYYLLRNAIRHGALPYMDIRKQQVVFEAGATDGVMVEWQ